MFILFAIIDVEKAKTLFESATKHYNDAKLEQSFLDCKAAADLGHAEACSLVAFMLERGKGVDIDEEVAMHYHEKAAKLDFVLSQCALGNRLRDTDRNHESIGWWIKAAAKDFADAHLMLGDTFRDGKCGVKDNKVMAIFHYQQAIKTFVAKKDWGSEFTPQRAQAALNSLLNQ